MTIEAAFALSAQDRAFSTCALAVKGGATVLPGLIGKDALRAADLAAYRPAPAPWFDPEPYIGKRGHKYHTGAAKILGAAVGLALADAGLSQEEAAGDDVGIAVGTNFAAHPALRDIDENVARGGTDLLSPLTAPHFSVNLSACLVGIRTATTGFNVTLTDPVTAGLGAVVFARHAIASGLVRRVVAGACEDEADARLGDSQILPRAGAAAFVVERATGEGATIVDAFSMRLTAGSEERLVARLARARRQLSGDVTISVTALQESARERIAGLARAAASMCGGRGERVSSGTDDGSIGAVSALVPLARACLDGRDAIVAAQSPGGAVSVVILAARGSDQ